MEGRHQYNSERENYKTWKNKLANIIIDENIPQVEWWKDFNDRTLNKLINIDSLPLPVTHEYLPTAY